MELREQVESDFGRRVHDARERAGWSQDELAKRMSAKGVLTHASTIAKLESPRKPRAVRLAEAVVLADLFGVSIDALLGRQAVPGDDLAFALLALHDAASGAMWQITGVREGFLPRLREALAFDFKGRDLVEAQGMRAAVGLNEAHDAVSQLALRLPELTERTEQ
jgi:transcriptional regulator with XRE-family HTH domain